MMTERVSGPAEKPRPIFAPVRVSSAQPFRRAQRGARPVGLAALLVLSVVGRDARSEEEPVIEKLDHGEVNWTKKTVIATGSGAPDLKQPNVAAVRLNAERAAVVNAYRNLLEALKGVKVTASVPSGSRLEDAQVKTEVEGIVRGCKTVDTRYYSDGGVDVVVRCPLDGALSTVLAPVKERKSVPEKGEKRYSGLIVDAVGLKATPALAPRILDESGNEIYVREMVLPATLREIGAATYARSVESGRRDQGRVGANPIVIKASGVGPVSSDLVLSKEEAAKLADQNLSFLSEARVVIALGAP